MTTAGRVSALLLGVVCSLACLAQDAAAQPPSPRSAVQAPPAAPPRPAPPGIAGRILTLEEAVAIALETQPQIHARLSDYAAARFRVDAAVAPLLPQLSGTWVAARTQAVSGNTTVSASLSPRTLTFFTTTTTARVTLSQLLFDFGKTLASTDVARKLAEVALADVELQRQTVALAVKEAYTNILFAQRLIRVNQQAVERAELNLRSARGFFEVGTRPKSDVARAEVDVANARVDLIRARNAERLARVALNTAMGIDVDTPTQVQDNLVYEAVSLDRAQLRTESLRNRPEYRQAQLRVGAAESTERQTFRNFFPDITGGAFYGAARPDMNEIWEFNIALQWSIFDGGNRLARYRESKAALDAAQARVRATELDIAREVEQAQISVEETQERIGAAQTAVASAQENFRLAQGRFDAGVGTILELTDAQLALTLAQNTEAQALADFRIALYRLERAIGRR
jgi:outer membrane protein